MTNVIKKTPNEFGKYEFLINVDLSEYPESEWAHNPNIDDVADEPRLYWKWDDVNSKVIEMTQAEKDIIDDGGQELLDDNGNSITVNIADTFSKSPIDGKKLAVHTSYKPQVDGVETYAIWTGAGDDMSDPINGCGNGPLLQLHTEIDVLETHVDVKFNPIFGKCWMHEAYIKFTGGGIGDYMSATIMASGVPLQQAAYLDLILDGDFIKYSPTGPGTGTHGFADPNNVSLITRSHQKDGDWDLDAAGDLKPNFTGTGLYKMSTNDKPVQRFINKISCYGDCSSYISLSSDETSRVWPNYYARMTAHNISNTVWHLSGIMELYRETTFSE